MDGWQVINERWEATWKVVKMNKEIIFIALIGLIFFFSGLSKKFRSFIGHAIKFVKDLLIDLAKFILKLIP